MVLLLTISFIDYRQMIIPNGLNFLLAASGIFTTSRVLENSIVNVLTQATVVLILMSALAKTYAHLRKVSGLGGGDIKFLGAATCWVGLLGLPWTLLIASLSGLTFVTISFLMGYFQKRQRVAFGPHLCLGLFIAWVLRDELFNYPI